MIELKKRSRGRPAGSVKPLEEHKLRRTVRMDEDLWAWCQRQEGGAGEYLRRLAQADRKKRRDKS